MKIGMSGLLGAALALASIAVRAQITTLDYQGNLMMGSGTYMPTGFTTPTLPYALPTADFAGTVSVEITLPYAT